MHAKYKRGKTIYDGKHGEIYERASKFFKGTPHEPQLKTLFIAVNLMDILITKPADLLVGEPPVYDSGMSDASIEQQRLASIVEENDLNLRIHETTIGAGYRGDSWLKTYYGYREDFSETPEGYKPPAGAKLEPIIEAIPARYVFPEFHRGSEKRFKAVNIAWIEHVKDARGDENSYLNVERHVPGFILYSRYLVEDNGSDTQFEVPIERYKILERVETGREDGDIEETGVPKLLVHHIPYKACDENWFGVSGIEKIESKLAAINDRLQQIDYVITKHSDPVAYGPEIDDGNGTTTITNGGYIPLEKDDPTPGYMEWGAQLDAAFRQLDTLIKLVFQAAETPQWVFGTNVAGDTAGGTGTSHTDGGAIKARFFPLLSKVKRIRERVDIAVRDALYTAMLLENFANRDNPEWQSYEPPYPKIRWKDGIPRDEKLEAEVTAIRTGDKPTLDQRTAIKQLDGLDDEKAQKILDEIEADEKRLTATVEPSVFNAEVA